MNTCYNPFSLKGKTILVTGASSGIGNATAIECSRMGAKMIITGRNEERLNQTFSELEGEDHKLFVGDLTQDEELKSLVDSIDKIDGVVLCAGILENCLISFSSKKKFQRILNTNLLSLTELIRLLLKGKKLTASASIVAVSSIAAFSHGLGNGIYGAGKAALSAWIKYAAFELGPKGLRFNSICPGMIETPLIRGSAFTDEQLSEDMKKYPLRRYGQPEDIAYGAIYLLSEASSWITGINLIIDGGRIL